MIGLHNWKAWGSQAPGSACSQLTHQSHPYLSSLHAPSKCTPPGSFNKTYVHVPSNHQRCCSGLSLHMDWSLLISPPASMTTNKIIEHIGNLWRWWPSNDPHFWQSYRVWSSPWVWASTELTSTSRMQQQWLYSGVPPWPYKSMEASISALLRSLKYHLRSPAGETTQIGCLE